MAFVTLKGEAAEGDTEAVVADLRQLVATTYRTDCPTPTDPSDARTPKTRSGKIMRRLLRDVAENRALGDVTTLLDPTVVNAIKDLIIAAPDEE